MAKAFSLQLGSSPRDVVPYVRNLLEDTEAPFAITDSGLQAYAEEVNEDFSRHVPLDFLVGNPTTNSSPLVTVANQQRYVFSPANGFTAPIMWSNDVLYRAGTGYSAASEIAFLALLPFSPINRFLFTPSLLDSPTERILRDEYLGELEHYGYGYYDCRRDGATGYPCVDLYPTPVIAGIPIYVRYQAMHVITKGEDIWTISTIPDIYTRVFSRLLAATAMEQEGYRILKAREVKAGLIQTQADSRTMEARIERFREEAYATLGSHAGVGIASVS